MQSLTLHRRVYLHIGPATMELHITNGDAAANLLKASGMAGDVLVWRDPMHHGPFPATLDLDAASDLRARYLGGATGSCEDAARDFQLRNDHLKAARRYSEVILWFEHDLLDQLQILQLLDWFSGADLGATQISLICIDRFPGIEPFRGLGQLSKDEIAGLRATRRPVTRAQLDLAVAGWAAFRAPTPTPLEAFLASDLAPLPFLHAALARHLEEFPWTIDGLTRSERQILELVRLGVQGPGKLFAENMGRETALFEGDWRSFKHIADLCAAREPLLRCEPDGTFRHPPVARISRAEFLKQRLALTGAGEEILALRRNASALMNRDEWLGGVHLSSRHSLWMWDSAQGRCVLRQPSP
jgi:hypothetical protein